MATPEKIGREDVDALASASGELHAMLAAASTYTADHSDDVVVIADALCDELGITGADRADLLAAAKLHDIGKTALPAEIIEKPGPLTESEWELMRKHTIEGERILAKVPELAGIGSIVRHSHERWDGDGYPDGLAGEEIPLASRTIFCADAFHAIRCKRPYRDGRSAAASLAEVRRHSGTQFDPTVVEALERVVLKLKLAPPPRRRRNRLMALLLTTALLGGTTALGASDLIGGDPKPAPKPPEEAAAGAEMLSISVNELISGPRAGDAKKPSSEKRAGGGSREPSGEGADDAPSSGSPGAPTTSGGAPTGGSQGSAGGGNSNPAPSTGTDNGSSGNSPGTTPSQPDPTPAAPTTPSTGSGSSHPHGGPPGQTGQHPHGGPPGQTGQHPHGGPPGQTKKTG